MRALAGEDARPRGRGAAGAGGAVAAGHPALHPAGDLARSARPARPHPAHRHHHRAAPRRPGVRRGAHPSRRRRGESLAGSTAVVCPIRDDGTTLGYLAAAEPGQRPAHRSARARAAGDAVGLPRRRPPQLAAVRPGRRHQALAGAAHPVGRRWRSSRWTATTSSWAGIRPPSACSDWPRATPWAAPSPSCCPGAVHGRARGPVPGVARARLRGGVPSRRDGTSLNLVVTLSALTGRDGRSRACSRSCTTPPLSASSKPQMLQSEKLTALGQMAGGIAHDFNNLLQAILGYAQLMGKNPANVDVVRRGLDVIEAAATGGAETVRRIQKFARLRPDEPFVSLDLNAWSTTPSPSHSRAGRSARPRAACPSAWSWSCRPSPAVMGRPSELNEVMTNLILNAIDAMPRGRHPHRSVPTSSAATPWCSPSPTPVPACRKRCASACSTPSSPRRARRERGWGCPCPTRS